MGISPKFRLRPNLHKHIKVVWNNKLKKDYWQLTPFYKYIKSEDTKGAFEWVKKQTWRKLTEEYIKLWKN